jgi:general secretion pathway protein L
VSAAALSLSSVGDVLRRSWRWWSGELATALPAWVISLALGDRRHVHLEIGASGKLQARLTPACFASRALAEGVLDPEAGKPDAALRAIRAAARLRPVVLTVPDDRVLTQTVLVPRAALENLPQAVSFGLSTWTPFTADMLIYCAEVVELRGEQARIRIRMVPRAVIEPLVADAARAHVRVTSVAFGRSIVDYSDPGQAASNRKKLGGRIDLVLLLLALALAAAILVTLHLRWSAELVTLQDGIRKEIALRTKQASLEQQLAQLRQRRSVVLAKRAREPRVSSILSDLATRVPDEAEVTEFDWGGGRGRIVLSAPEGLDVQTELQASNSLKIERPVRSADGRLSFEFMLAGGAK